MSDYFGIIATSESGSTAAMELVSGRITAAERISELIASGHSVRLFTCKQVEYDVYQTVNIVIK